MRGVWLGVILALAAGAAAAQTDVEEGRQLAAQLANDLASHASATQVLEDWCAQRDLAAAPVIVAERQTGKDKPASARTRELLRASPDEPIAYRRVALTCGGRVLSRADNWYRPGRLTAAMNDALATTDTPFGVVVAPLQFHRESLEAKTLIKPDAAKLPAEIIRNKALLETPDGVPFSLVVETYSHTLLEHGHREPSGRLPGLRMPRKSRAVVVAVREPRAHRERGPRRPRAPREPHAPREHHDRERHDRERSSGGTRPSRIR